MSREGDVYLRDILDCCDVLIEWTVHATQESVFADRKTVRAIERELFIIGEAVKHVPLEIRLLAEDIPWGQIARFRDVLAHNYGRVEPDAVWQVVKAHVPRLRAAVVRLLELPGELPDEQAR